ncbi:hypothetical protein L6452_05276 [Arctium lappa]|uniref:Uncharacterized protein n=1 Tax=Arctium lappa TaxID=4217 RepID=A0ACB9EFC8_ARCLA|nr:hypothetical protein L6452_05276 [Arctium lappa]
MPMQTLFLCNSHPPIPIHAKSLNQNLPWNPSLVTTFKKSLINSSIFTLTTHHKINKNRRFTVFAVKGEEDEQSTPPWAKPYSEEPPPWARNETQQLSSSSNSDLPFFCLLACFCYHRHCRSYFIHQFLDSDSSHLLVSQLLHSFGSNLLKSQIRRQRSKTGGMVIVRSICSYGFLIVGHTLI